MPRVKIEKPFTTAQVVSYIADQTGLTKNDVKAVLDSLEEIITLHLKKKGVQKFNFLGMAQFKIDRVARRAARPGRNPATGEEITIPAKPAHNKAKLRVLKKLKDLA